MSISLVTIGPEGDLDFEDHAEALFNHWGLKQTNRKNTNLLISIKTGNEPNIA